MTPRPLPASTPAAQGVDARGVAAFLDALEDSPEVDPHSVMVLRHGAVVAAGWWAPYTAERVHLVYSLSKSFTSAALGLAVAEGLVDLDAPVVDSFPDLDDEVTDPRARAILVRHLAAMASGHTTDTWAAAVEGDPDEPVRGFLRLPVDREPGSVFAYNQPCTYTLAAIIQRASGQTLTEYLRPRLFEPLGIDDAAWQQHPAGRDVGFTGLHVTTDAVARLGQLHLQGGAWAGRQVLPRAWVAEATRPHIATAGQGDPDWELGYGYQFWTSRHGYRGDGAFGQFCLVLPEADAVVAITSATGDMQGVLDAVWRHLVPALTGGPAPDGADAALAERLQSLSLPPVRLQPSPADVGAWDGATSTPAGGDQPDQPSLAAVGVTAVDGGWELTLDEGHRLVASLGTDGWAVSEPAAPGGGVVPVAVSGGWSAPGVLRADVLFLETPHRLTLTCALADRSFEARWSTAPLWPSRLHALRSPR